MGGLWPSLHLTVMMWWWQGLNENIAKISDSSLTDTFVCTR